MVTRNLSIGIETGQIVTQIATPIFIRGSSDLAPALRQREQPIVIENREIDLKFRRYVFLEGLTKLILIGWCAHLLSGAVLKAIEKDYHVQGTAWHDWKINKSGGSITLTPTKPEKPADTDTRPKPP